MSTEDAPFTKTGLTLQQAELRIEELEAAAAMAADLAARTKNHQALINARIETILTCVDLLVDQLEMDGGKHSEYVTKSLELANTAATQLRNAVGMQKDTQK